MITDFSRSTSSADGDPNSAAPAAANIMTVEERVGTYQQMRVTDKVIWYISTSTGSATCDVQWYEKDVTSGKWVAIAQATGVADNQHQQTGVMGAPGGASLFPRVTNISAGTITVYACAG